MGLTQNQTPKLKDLKMTCASQLMFLNVKLLYLFFAVCDVWEAFANMTAEAFKFKYNFPKPDQSTKLGLNCLKGRESYKILGIHSLASPCSVAV